MQRVDTTHPRQGTETPCIKTEDLPRPDTTHPRQGTETGFRHCCARYASGHNASPPGDGDSAITSSPQSICGHNASPPGDGDMSRLSKAFIAFSTQRIPARGRRHRSKRCSDLRHRHNASPPGDGDLNAGPVHQPASLGHNASPPGDGDLSAVSSRPCASTQHIPARGRRHIASSARAVNGTTQHIPARGRKHFGLNVFLRCFRRTYHIPARGRKLPFSRTYCGKPGDTTHPRQGTETMAPRY